MKKKTRKKTWRTLLGFLLCIFTMTVCVWADEGTSQNPDYVTDYYMVVESPEGGIDIYSEADPQSTKLNGELIPNGIAIRIQGEKTGTDNKKWGYTQYHGMNGYVPMDNLDPVSRSEAVKSEYKVLGGQDADFDVKINSQDKAAVLYNGPGEKFGEVSGTGEIANGTSVHISQYVESEDGSSWGKTSIDDKEGNSTEGWLNLDKDTDYKPAASVDMTTIPEAASAENGAATPEATPTAKVTPTVEPTPTAEATPTVEATPTAEATPTVEATPTTEATPTVDVTPTTEATPTVEATPTTEAAPTEKAEKASSGNISASLGGNVAGICISIAGAVFLAGLLFYFLKKKK